MSMFHRLIVCCLLVIGVDCVSAENSQITRIHFPEIGSTQTFCQEHAEEILDAPGQWVVVTADCQTNGMGHQGRKWVSSSTGNLYATFVTFFPKDKEEEFLHIIQVAAFSVVKTLQGFGLQPGIKWVNDVFVNDKKISGCLCELIPSSLDGYDYLLVGIGININMSPEELTLISKPATSILAETLQKADKEAVLISLSDHLQDVLTTLLQEGFSAFHEEIDHLLVFKGRLVDIELEPASIIQGRIQGIAEDGALLLEMPSGEIERVFEGRVIQVIEESATHNR